LPPVDSALPEDSSTSVEELPTRASRRRQQENSSAAPADRRALVGASALGLAAAAGAVLLDGAAGTGSVRALAQAKPPGTAAAGLSVKGPAPSKVSVKAKPATSGTKPSKRASGAKPAAAAPAADRDASYSAGTKRSSRTGRMYTNAAQASRSLASAKLLVAAGTMSPSLVAKGIKNTPETTAHLLARATFGARPADRDAVAKLGIDGWLAQQLDPAKLADPGGDAVRGAFPLADKSISGVRSSVKEFAWDAAVETAMCTLGLQVHSSRQLFEIVVDVLGNQLNVTTPSESTWAAGPDYAKSVIRKHAFGKFRDMLLAAMRHPAMLVYLNNNESTRTSVNENLGRELLELHSVGVSSGYTETDVRNSAYILSGRSVDWKTSEFVWLPDNHWVGKVKVLGFSNVNSDAGSGLEMGDAYVSYLANHPSTAQTIARKLAVRFVSDKPPKSLVDRMAKAYTANDTAIIPVLRTLFNSTEFWSAPQAKSRRPLEDGVGSVRAVDVAVDGELRKGIESLYWTLNSAGHAPLGWIPPNGYPDVAAAWQSASQMVSRWNVHRGSAGGYTGGLKPAKDIKATFTPTAGMTYTVWIDLISHHVIGKALDKTRRAAILSYLEAKATDVVPEWRNWEAPIIAAFVLDSPYHQFR
jgi:uncharacterized protein (DUF1800 family)